MVVGMSYGECNVVSNEYDEPTSFHVQPIGAYGGDVMYFGCFCFRGELNCCNICMCVVNKQFLIPFILACSIIIIGL